MLRLGCAKCYAELDEPGALIFSPPFLLAGKATEQTDKFHICEDCWEAIFGPLLRQPEDG